jgi:FtsP/CotA-like multicopper oxidase with cupredoxin domain
MMVDVEEALLPSRRSSRHKRWWLGLTISLPVFLITFFLIHYRHDSSWQQSPSLAQNASSYIYGAAADERFKLSPERHIFRNTTSIQQTWHITQGLRRPDGVLKQLYLINDYFPGPTLEARSGDEFIIHVVNDLHDESVSIHWHGLSMRGANGMDGAVGLTQDPIMPGKSFTYQIRIDAAQSGSFWYHAHDGVQRADGLFGGLVVHKPASMGIHESAADEHLLLIGDWYHRAARDALEFYMHPGAFGLETVPDSLLLNGVGRFQCDRAVPARPLDCTGKEPELLSVLSLDPSKRSILRIVNVGAYAGFSISTPGATLTPLSVDGGHSVTGPPSKAVGFIHPGERVDLAIAPTTDIGHVQACIQITLDDEAFKYDNPALSITHTFPLRWTPSSGQRPDEAGASIGHFDLQTVLPSTDPTKILPDTAQETIVLYTLTQKLAKLETEPHGFINHTTWLPQSPPLIAVPRDMWDDNQFVPHINYNKVSPLWVDIILNNLDEDNHPFHLHGHDFWVVAKYSSDENWGSYNPYDGSPPPGGEYNFTGALRRDTVYVPRRGYAVLRFQADNPGIWAFHCHVLWHEASGMAMAFDVS